MSVCAARLIAAVLPIFLFTATAAAQTFTFTAPSDDRWNYPFNFTPGTRTNASIFGTVGDGRFNDRDGQMLVAWNTAAQIAPGQGAANYAIQSIKVTLVNLPNATWMVDGTTDEWFTHDINADGFLNADGFPRGHPSDTDGESTDSDPGRPIEMWGVGFDPTYTAATWNEFSPYIGADPGAPTAPRDPFPFTFQTGTLAMLHVEDSVRGLHNDMLANPVFQFSPQAWATGVPIGYTPGSQTNPFPVEFELNLSLFGGAVRQHFQQQLDAGRLFVAVAALHDTIMFGDPQALPNFYTKEGIFLHALAAAPRLEIVLAAPDVPGDIDGDGDVDAADLGFFTNVLLRLDLGADHLARSDLNDSGAADGDDLQPFVALYF